jgi:hypothetical protein
VSRQEFRDSSLYQFADTIVEVRIVTIGEREREAIRKFVAACLKGATSDHVIVTPVRWHEDERGGEYFIVSTFVGAFHSAQFVCGDGVDADEARDELLAQLELRGGLIVHDVDDELKAVRLAAQLWPCAKTRMLRDSMEAEAA